MLCIDVCRLLAHPGNTTRGCTWPIACRPCVSIHTGPALILFACAAAMYLMWEVSTPCVYLRWLLAHLGKNNTRLYVANGLAMLGTFFVARNLLGLCASSLSLDSFCMRDLVASWLPVWLCLCDPSYNTRLYVANGLAMLGTYFVVRNLLGLCAFLVVCCWPSGPLNEWCACGMSSGMAAMLTESAYITMKAGSMKLHPAALMHGRQSAHASTGCGS